MTNTVSVLVTPILQPHFTGIHHSGDTIVLSGTGGLPFATYFLQAATDALMPGANWIRIVTNQFDAGGNFNFTDTVNIHSAQKFYRLEIP